MNSSIAAEIANLESFSVVRLVERYEQVTGELCHSRNKRYLIRRIAWRLQSSAEGGLLERARKRAAERASGSVVRNTPPKQTNSEPVVVQEPELVSSKRDKRLRPPGRPLVRTSMDSNSLG